MKRTILIAICVIVAIFLAKEVYESNFANRRVVVAYVTAGSDVVPDPSLMTHINYAFGHVADSFDSLIISRPERLDQIVALKAKNPKLKVLISVGGWGSGNFSEMAADSTLRARFVQSCIEAVNRHKLDGVDIDWEYPTSSAAGISSSPDDTHNFTLLMRDLRQALGHNDLLTFASVATAKYVDFPAVLPYLDFVNVMSYDMAVVPRHHSALRAADDDYLTIEKAVQHHLDAGVPADKLVVGLAFYGKGTVRPERGAEMQTFITENALTEHWNEEGQYAYLTDSIGNVVYSFDNARSLAEKCRFANQKQLRGAMYWEYSRNDSTHNLSRAVWDVIMAEE